MARTYSAEQYEDLFEREALADRSCERAALGVRELSEALSQKNVKVYCAKSVRAGGLLEVDLFPRWNTRAEAGRARQARRCQSQTAIENRNNRNAERKITRLLNEYFTDGDYALYLSYREAPESVEQMKKDLARYVGALRKAYKAAGVPEFRYLYIMEHADRDGKPVRPHFHIFLPRGLPRERLEDLWRDWHGRANSTRLGTDEYGLTGFATYVLKAPRDVKNLRRWACSRNMQDPEPRRSARLPDGRRLTKKLIRDLSAGRKDAKAIFERAYPGYAFLDLRERESDYVSGSYVYIRMRRIGGAPPRLPARDRAPGGQRGGTEGGAWRT